MARTSHVWANTIPDRDTTCLLTARCELRCVTEVDALALFEASLSPGFSQWLSWNAPATVEPLTARFLHQRRAWTDGEAFSFCAHCRFDDHVLGGAELKPDPVAPQPNRLNLGYWVAPAHQGRGLATEIVGRVVQFAFELGCQEIIAGVGEHNAPSQRVLLKLGFVAFEQRSVCSATKAFPNVRYRRGAAS